MEQSLEGNVVFVTGSARRVGKEILLNFAQEGANLVIHHHNSDDAAETTAQEARDLGAEVLIIKGDHAKHSDVEKNFDSILKHFGRLDVLVNSAGVFHSGDILDISQEDWEQTISLNLSAPFWCTQLAGRIMRDQHIQGSIINIGDNSGLRPWAQRPHHSISKAGVVMLTQVTARALAPYKIRANCIIPGPVLPASNMDDAYWQKTVSRLPLARSGDPRDVSRAAVFLAKNDFITGEILRVDGGEFLGESSA